MFTGIVETVGTIIARTDESLEIRPRLLLKGLSVGESVSVNGVCLTVNHRTAQRIGFCLLKETVRVSALGSLRNGECVNLERAARVGGRLGGHLLLGHVDGTGTVVGRSRQKNGLTLEVEIPSTIVSTLVPKGPIGLDGVSLTLDPMIMENRIRVHLVPHTIKITTLGQKPLGARLNVEIDLVAKYLQGML